MLATSELATTFVVAAVAALVAAPLAGAVARRLGAISQPSDERWNRRPVPLLGGVAIWLATLAALAQAPTLPSDILLILGAGTAMFALGLIDDFVHLKPMTKLICQVVIACASVIALEPPGWTG